METIFLAGATGFLGKPTLELLVKSNFKVYGITRKKENAELIKSLGGIPVIGDLTRIGEWIGFLKDSDIVIDLVKDSAIDNINGLEKAEQQSQIKKKTVQNIIEFSNKDRLSAYIYVLSFDAYQPQQSKWIDETSAWKTEPDGCTRVDKAALQLINQYQKENSFPAIFSHFGIVYGKGYKFEQVFIENIKNGTFPIIGRGDAWLSWLHLEDAARALKFLAQKKPVGERINVVDDEPVQFKTFVNFLVKKLNAPKPQRITQMAAKMMIGNVWVEVICKSRKVKNDKLKKWGFELKYPNYMVGIESLFNNGL